MNNISRRKWITSGVAVTAGASGVAVAARLAGEHGLLPPDCTGVYGAGNSLTYAAQRTLTGQALAREFPASEISKAPFAKLRPFQIDAYDKSRANGFTDWKVEVDGMVAKPMSLSIADLKGLPARKQITQLACEEGWSYIAEWTGAPIAEVLKAAGALPEVRYMVYYSIQKNWWESIDMADAMHPQTVLAYGMNGADLPMGFGGPLRLRVARQLGYKNVKFINKITFTDSLEKFKKRSSYSWYAGI